MSQTQDTKVRRVLDALRAAATSGQVSVLREVQADVVLLYEEHLLPELLRLCSSNESGQNLVLLNAAWKLLLSVVSLSTISALVYGRILQFMLSQLQHHVFSHDWLDGRKVKLAAFVASHVVSAVRAHPFYAVSDATLVGAILELHSIACLTVATSGHAEAARQLHQSIVVRLLAILESMGSACTASQPLSSEAHLRLLLRCLDGPPPAAAAELPTLSVAAGSSVAALATMLAVVRSYKNFDLAYVERLLAAFLLWVPDMQLVLSDLGDQRGEAATPTSIGEDSVAFLRHCVLQHAKNLPRSLFFAGRDNNEAAECSGEVNLHVQLLLLLRDLACRGVDAVRCEGWRDWEAASSGGAGSLLCCRVFSLLLTALLVPNDASVAFVLLVWGAVLNRLSDTERESLGAELLQLGEEQLSALRELPPTSGERAIYLRRFLNTIAVLLAEINRLLSRSPELLLDAVSETSAMRSLSPSSFSFDSLADVLYHQTCVYQWWNEEAAAREGVKSSAGAEAIVFQDELQAMLVEWKQRPLVEDSSGSNQRLCAILVSFSGRVKGMLERSTSPHSVIPVMLVVTRVLQSVVEMTNPSYTLCVCARFVAAELVAVAGFVPSEDSTFLACVRRLVDISFGTTEDGAEVQVRGMLRYHAAVCLRNFVQRNTLVPLDKLRFSQAVSAALMSLLQGGVLSDSGVNTRNCENLLAGHAEAWQGFVLRGGPTTTSSQTTGSFPDPAIQGSCVSSQSGSLGHEGRFFLSLQRCEGTVQAVLQWLEAGRALHPSEEEALARLEQLVRGAANMTRPTLTSTGELVCSSLNTVSGEVQATERSPDIIVE